MGANQSSAGTRPEAGSFVWKPLTGSLAQDLQALKNSNETDASRAKAIEAEFQARVAAEVARIQAASAAETHKSRETLLAEASAAAPDAPAKGAPALSREVQELRAQLGVQKQRRERPVSAAVESARQDVTMCLSEKDRRPLDCWREVERFREEVAKLERKWLDDNFS